ncbi:universal stress protein [Luteimonas aquatica]|uniref:universal stress protein n=1 Tax=Luteimonas aquatica TaxID=450364 RepID=UPI001F57F780|nr:universal stress protein [Luteimonas aquatica]
MAKYVLVGYDGSDSSKRAFRFAVDLARAFDGRIRAVTVLQPVVEGMGAVAAMMVDDGPERAGELLRQLAAEHPEAAGRIEAELVAGNPGDVLLAQIEQYGIDHLVIGHSERGALARWLVGSVSTEVLARAHVPVTVVR